MSGDTMARSHLRTKFYGFWVSMSQYVRNKKVLYCNVNTECCWTVVVHFFRVTISQTPWMRVQGFWLSWRKRELWGKDISKQYTRVRGIVIVVWIAEKLSSSHGRSHCELNSTFVQRINSSSKRTFSQPFKEICINERVKIGSIIIFHLSTLWKPSSSYCVMGYFWQGCRRNLTLITLWSERVDIRRHEILSGIGNHTGNPPNSSKMYAKPEKRWFIFLCTNYGLLTRRPWGRVQ